LKGFPKSKESIANFSQRLRAYEDGPEKQGIVDRLARLKQDLSEVQDALAIGPEEFDGTRTLTTLLPR
jgi:hypothetical protein